MQLQITTDKFHLIRHYQCGTSKLYQCDTFRPILHSQILIQMYNTCINFGFVSELSFLDYEKLATWSFGRMIRIL